MKFYNFFQFFSLQYRVQVKEFCETHTKRETSGCFKYSNLFPFIRKKVWGNSPLSSKICSLNVAKLCNCVVMLPATN